MNEPILKQKDVILAIYNEYALNVIECYGLMTEIVHKINPSLDQYVRLCMKPQDCLWAKWKQCKYWKNRCVRKNEI